MKQSMQTQMAEQVSHSRRGKGDCRRAIWLWQVCWKKSSWLFPRFPLWWGRPPNSGLPEEADPSGKLELVPVEGWTVTRSQQLSQSDTGHTDQPEKERVTKNNTQTKDKVTENLRQKRPNKTTIQSTHDLSYSKSECLANLNGTRALTHCNLNGLAVSVLLDTGAKVNMIDRDRKSKY